MLGFSALFATYGAAFGSLGAAERIHARGLSQILGVVLILLGLLFAGAFDRFGFAGRIIKPSLRPRAGLATRAAARGAVRARLDAVHRTRPSAPFSHSASPPAPPPGVRSWRSSTRLGVGIPFLIVAFAVERGMKLLGFARRHARLITRIGGLLLVAVGLLEVTGAWSSAMSWLQVHWLGGYNAPF